MIGNQEGLDINTDVRKSCLSGSHDFFADFIPLADEFFNRVLGNRRIDDFCNGWFDDGIFNVIAVPAINISDLLGVQRVDERRRNFDGLHIFARYFDIRVIASVADLHLIHAVNERRFEIQSFIHGVFVLAEPKHNASLARFNDAEAAHDSNKDDDYAAGDFCNFRQIPVVVHHEVLSLLYCIYIFLFIFRDIFWFVPAAIKTLLLFLFLFFSL